MFLNSALNLTFDEVFFALIFDGGAGGGVDSSHPLFTFDLVNLDFFSF